jgi:hypothetical protein
MHSKKSEGVQKFVPEKPSYIFVFGQCKKSSLNNKNSIRNCPEKRQTNYFSNGMRQ